MPFEDLFVIILISPGLSFASDFFCKSTRSQPLEKVPGRPGEVVAGRLPVR